MSGPGAASYPSDMGEHTPSHQVQSGTTSQVVTTQNTDHQDRDNSTRQVDNIGSIITMLISDQSVCLEDYISDQLGGGDAERLLQADVKEETLCETVMTQQQLQQQQQQQQQHCQTEYYSSQHFQLFKTRSSPHDVEEKLLYSYQTPPPSLPSYSTFGYSSPLVDMSNFTSKRELELEIPEASHHYSGRKRDQEYWERRRKNNLAAKKSRDSRRVRENQLRLRVLCLENANRVLREQMNNKEGEVVHLRDRLNKYENQERQALFCE